ncbi:MAG: AmmeMemoRadiSam system protein B [Deltaproteobacteria bacterium]|nr:AmmeMemoRadiSam system protein B [Deltaproteobacteria bacterium]
MPGVRAPAVAGQFYPEEPEALRASIRTYLHDASCPPGGPPKAVIAPHAGYVYSGPIAGSAYARIEPLRDRIERVVLLGPSHRVFLRGLAAPAADSFATPLGPVAVDREAIARILDLPQVVVSSEPHAFEHSLEVHLPFLQEILDDVRLVPLVVGDATGEEVASVLERLWGGEETLIVVSSDLSHYHDYASACRMDAETTRAIEALRADAIDQEGACGRIPVQGLLLAARAHGLRVEAIDVRNSGDTAGPRDRVVGYGAYVFS